MLHLVNLPVEFSFQGLQTVLINPDFVHHTNCLPSLGVDQIFHGTSQV